jgi:hypothetical protein
MDVRRDLRSERPVAHRLSRLMAFVVLLLLAVLTGMLLPPSWILSH